MADGHGRDVVVFRKGQQHFQFAAQHGSGWMRLVQRRAVARQPAAAVGKGRKVGRGKRGQGVLERRLGVPGQNLLRAILKEPGEEGGAFRDQMAGHVPFHDRKCPLEIARRVIVLHRRNEFVLRREPVAAAAVDSLPLFAWKCTEQAQQQAPEYGVDGVHAAPFPAADKRVLSDKRLQSCPSIRAAAEIRLRQGELLKRTECEKHVPHVRGEWAIKLFFQKRGHIRWQFVLGILRGR